MERVLTFKYPYERKEEKDIIKEVLTENNIEFICYESEGYYPHEFVIRKSGRKWDDIRHIINSVLSARYSFKNTEIKKIDGKLITKTRYKIPLENGRKAELDIFHGYLEGLQFVEVEFDSTEQAVNFQPPEWFGEDVSTDHRFANNYLCTISEWKEIE